MKIEEIEDKKTWDTYFDENGSPSFLQSWEWGELQKSLGYDVLRLGIYSSSEVEKSNERTSRQARTLTGIAQVIKTNSKRGNFLFIPHGPIFKLKTQSSSFDKLRPSALRLRLEEMTLSKVEVSNVKTIIKELLKYLIEIAKNEDYSFIRVAPTLLDTKENQQIFSDLGFKKAPIYMHAERLWILPLVETRHAASLQYGNDEELLSQMRKTTRYLIRKAERDGVIIEKRNDEKAVDDFDKIYQETAKRENFVPFSKNFIKEEFYAFNKTVNAIFLFGKVNTSVIPDSIRNPDKIDSRFRGNDNNTTYLAASLIIFTKSTAFYHQGASIHSKVPVTYLLQWEAIKEARRRGCQFYNFWGIHQEGRTPKSWGGLTLFKQGFGGQQVDYLPTQDFIISPKYYLTYFYEKYLKWRRGV